MKATSLAAILTFGFTLGHTYRLPHDVDQITFHSAQEDIKVPVVLGVMSQCPDALLCESVFDRVLQRVADKVDLSLTFIGT
jgi:hypothetical protein